MLSYLGKWGRLAVLLFHLGTLTAQRGNAAPVLEGSQFDLGVGTHIGLRRDAYASASVAFAGLHSNSFRDEVLWSRVEVVKGELRSPPELSEIRQLAADVRKRSGGRPLLILNYGNPNYDGGRAPHSAEGVEAFARYVTHVAVSLRGVVDRFEVWNEWNRKAGFNSPTYKDGSPEVYAKLVQATRQALKSIDPNIEVVVGAVEGIDLSWLEAFGRAGGFKYADAVSLHPYAHHARRGPELSILRTEQSREVIERFSEDRAIPILLTEIGWPISRNPSGVTEATGADYVVRAMLLARARPWLRGVWWYNLVDSGRDSSNDEHNFGLLTKDGRQKEGYNAFSTVARLLGELRSVQEIATGVAGVRMVRTVNSSGECRSIVWSERPDRATTHSLTSMEWARVDADWVDAAPGPADDQRLPSTLETIPISGRPIAFRDCGSFSIQRHS